MQGLFEIMVQIKQKRGIGAENPSPRSFPGGFVSELKLRSTSSAENNFPDEITWIT
jgi:hypothetical protein